MARKRKSKPSTKARNGKQATKSRYARAREDAQLAGLIPTTPEGALRPEKVDPSSQDEQRFPGLDRMAIRNAEGWGITDQVKRKIVEVNAEVLYERRTYYDREGREVEAPPDRQAQVQASRVLMLADERDWERKQPEQAAKSEGGTQVNVFQVNNAGLEIEQLMRAVAEQKRIGREAEEAEAQAAPAADQPGTGAEGGTQAG